MAEIVKAFDDKVKNAGTAAGVKKMKGDFKKMAEIVKTFDDKVKNAGTAAGVKAMKGDFKKVRFADEAEEIIQDESDILLPITAIEEKAIRAAVVEALSPTIIKVNEGYGLEMQFCVDNYRTDEKGIQGDEADRPKYDIEGEINEAATDSSETTELGPGEMNEGEYSGLAGFVEFVEEVTMIISMVILIYIFLEIIAK